MHFYFNIFGKMIPGYSLSILTGVILANIIACYFIHKQKLSIDDVILCEAYGLLGALLGAKILYLWVSRQMIDWSRFFEFEYFNLLMRGGFVFYGGFIGGVIAFFIGCKIHKINVLKYIGLFSFSIPFVHAFGRIGCFLAGCCYGCPYDGIFSVVFPEGSYAPAGVPLFPVQIVEAIMLFLLFIIVLLVYLHSGGEQSVYVYLIGYAMIRFILEYFRSDVERGKLLWFSTSQWISIGILVITAFIIFRRKHVVRNTTEKSSGEE